MAWADARMRCSRVKKAGLDSQDGEEMRRRFRGRMFQRQRSEDRQRKRREGDGAGSDKQSSAFHAAAHALVVLQKLVVVMLEPGAAPMRRVHAHFAALPGHFSAARSLFGRHLHVGQHARHRGHTHQQEHEDGHDFCQPAHFENQIEVYAFDLNTANRDADVICVTGTAICRTSVI